MRKEVERCGDLEKGSEIERSFGVALRSFNRAGKGSASREKDRWELGVRRSNSTDGVKRRIGKGKYGS